MTINTQKIWILDGAMGTMIQRAQLSEQDFHPVGLTHHPVRLAGNNDLIALSRPDVLHHIHRSYLEAGADIITTNTFGAQSITQADYLTAAYVRDMNLSAARIAREEADRMTELTPEKPRLVAGSIGPTNRTLSMSPDVENPALRLMTFQDLKEAYVEQMVALMEGGVDLLLIETIFDTLNAKAALAAVHAAQAVVGRKVPVMLSATLADASGRTLSGQTLAAFVTSVSHDDTVIALGLNCSFGAKDMRPYLQELAALTPLLVTAHPNAGLPNEEGLYTETLADMAQAISGFMDDGSVNVVGGCCGSTPEHIRAIAAAAAGREARKPQRTAHAGWLAGLEAMTPMPGSFINVGERCNVAGSRKFLRLIKEQQYDEALGIALGQVADGAMLLDLNMDDALLDTQQELTHFLNLMASDPEVARVPWMIDSSRFEVIEAALQCVQGRAVVNSISLGAGEDIFLQRARTIHRYGAAMVVMAVDEAGQATTFDRKIAVCERAYRLLTEQAGIPANDIIFDPNILTVATGIKEHDRYALDFIEATAWIKRHLPDAHVSGGVSNLSFAFRGNNYLREAMHSVFLYHAMQAGMDMGIVNPATKVMYEDIPADLLALITDVILCRRADASERLTAAAQALLEQAPLAFKKAAEGLQTSRNELPLDARLMEALRTGNDEHLSNDLSEALKAYASPAAIIEGPLMAGMQRVGKRFSEGKMFLPQVVKSARIMKKAVAYLQPFMEQSKTADAAAHTNGRYLVATVKGDVHDIGKNIVAVVLGCNHFDVTDLGVMVSAEDIVKTILEKKIDFVSLSGLITPSLEEMCHTAKAMQAAGIRIPLFIGGATTSDLHTALKIAPLYDGPVFHVRDASQNPVLALQLLGVERERLIRTNRLQQAALVSQYEAKKQATALLQVAQQNGNSATDRLRINWPQERFVKPSFMGCRTLQNIPLEAVRPLINWTYFYHLWRVKPGSKEADDIKAEAECLLDELPTNCSLQARLGFFPAYGTPQSIVINATDACIELPTPRQAAPTEAGAPCLSLCDFVAPTSDPTQPADHIGAFAVTLSPDFVTTIEQAKQGADDYRSILLQSVADRLAEAGGEWLHREVRQKLWGYAPNERLTTQDLFKAAYAGIRPAVGYPSLPDQQNIFLLDQLLQLKEIGIELTENGAMYPQSSICGLMIANHHARYFSIAGRGL